MLFKLSIYVCNLYHDCCIKTIDYWQIFLHVSVFLTYDKTVYVKIRTYISHIECTCNITYPLTSSITFSSSSSDGGRVHSGVTNPLQVSVTWPHLYPAAAASYRRWALSNAASLRDVSPQTAVSGSSNLVRRHFKICGIMPSFHAKIITL